jgi:polysaccharide biosynthesis protein PslG
VTVVANEARRVCRRTFFGAVGMAAGAGLAACASKSSVRPPVASLSPSQPPPHEVMPVGFSLGSPVLWASDEDLAKTLDMVVESRATMVRFDVSWAFAEPVRGQLDWAPSDRVVQAAERRGLQMLTTVANTPAWASLDARRHTAAPADPARYAEFAAAVARRYGGRVKSFEIWNEPNGRIFFEPDPDPVRYTRMLVQSYAAIKAVRPESTVIGGALGATDHGDGVIVPVEFLKRMYQAGAAGSFDALSFHPYDYNAPLATGALYATSPMQQMVAMRELMTTHGDGAKPMWITEFGAPTSVVSEEMQSRLVVDSIRQWPEVALAGPFLIYGLRDAGSDSGDYLPGFGLTTVDFVPKKAFGDLRDVLAAGIPERDEYKPFADNQDSSLGLAVTPVFTVADGYGQQFERGTRFKTVDGFIDSPPAVAAIARNWQILPTGRFADGYQDFGVPTGARIFTSEPTGTHIVVGSILAAWTPELGFPVSDEHPVDESNQARAVDFEHGRITWAPVVGAAVVKW